MDVPLIRLDVPLIRRIGIREGFWGLLVGQAVEGEAAHGKGDGDPAFALIGATEVEVPQRPFVELGWQA